MKQHNYTNKSGWVKRCSSIEQASEVVFKECASRVGWAYLHKSTKSEDCFQHIDCYVRDRDGNKISVDLKGLKRDVKNGRVLVELQNVQGQKGWLFGKADLIAFQVGADRFLVCRRNDLFQLVKKLTNMQVFVKSGFRVLMQGKKVSRPENCLAPDWYGREDRPKEKVTFVPLEEIEKIALVM